MRTPADRSLFPSVRLSCADMCLVALAASTLVLIFLPAHARATEPQQEPCQLEAGRSGAVARVVDSETLIMDDGSEVRLIGALAPHAPNFGDASDWPPARSAMQALEALVMGRNIQLGLAGRRIDRHGRHLAHAFTVQNGQRIWVQGELLRLGHARAYGLPGNFTCIDELMSHERVAQHAQAGIWSNTVYRIRRAERTRDLMRLRNTYQIVEGVVREAADVRGRIYLNFGANWRDDFTAGIAPAAIQPTPQWREQLKALAGKTIRVRGWVERRNGPFIEVTDRSQIEILSPDQERPSGQTAPAHGVETSSQKQDNSAAPDTLPRDNAKRPAQEAPGAVDL